MPSQTLTPLQDVAKMMRDTVRNAEEGVLIAVRRNNGHFLGFNYLMDECTYLVHVKGWAPLPEIPFEFIGRVHQISMATSDDGEEFAAEFLKSSADTIGFNLEVLVEYFRTKQPRQGFHGFVERGLDDHLDRRFVWAALYGRLAESAPRAGAGLPPHAADSVCMGLQWYAGSGQIVPGAAGLPRNG